MLAPHNVNDWNRYLTNLVADYFSEPCSRCQLNMGVRATRMRTGSTLSALSFAPVLSDRWPVGLPRDVHLLSACLLR
jgi:hypothetical protein